MKNRQELEPLGKPWEAQYAWSTARGLSESGVKSDLARVWIAV